MLYKKQKIIIFANEHKKILRHKTYVNAFQMETHII